MSEILEGKCHCKEVIFTVKLTDGFNTIRRCNCSFCRMRGAVTVSANLCDIKIIKGKQLLTEYRFNTKTSIHYFCSICGIYTFHQRRSNPNQYGVNVACLNDVSPFDFNRVPVNNGIDHPSDGGGGIIAYLNYVKL